MSDSEGDFSDELLELAGASEKKRRKRQSQGKPMKRRRASGDLSDSDSDNGQSDKDEEAENPYPLEGKYIDEEDRERLLSLPEVEREDVLAQRQEELQRIQDKRNLDQMFKNRTGGDGSVSKAAKRQHAQRGATKEKSRKLDELKARRKAKGEKKRSRADSPRRDRSSSPMDMEMSDEEEEDGQINKFDEEDERENRLLGKTKVDDGPITVEDLMKVRLTRDTIARNWGKPWFEDLIQGAWVRYSCGFDKERQTPIYRICEIVRLLPKTVKEYSINNRTADQEFLLRYADQEKAWPMDKVSNAPFAEKEFQKLKSAIELAELTLPTKQELEAKAKQIDDRVNSSLTEADITAMLARKRNESAGRSAAALTLEKSRLNQARTLALRRKDYAEVAELDEKLAKLGGTGNLSKPQSPAPTDKDVAAQREHRAKVEAMRKAEQAELERRRQARKERLLALEVEGLASTPLSRLKSSALLDSRQGTPEKPVTDGSGSPAPTPDNSNDDFETSVLDNVEIDLGDF
ncbi:plus-3-domain-containing protein [Trametopsis cervina]|nr:plus-3-domain-containing protein [Trametopsis cervina]